jgi:pimeloyl-ACP methyl ester carboxylesterase|tara:strand:+ start:1407 stop:2216 length:810 start_codon:yes stop_codon:yes gene_type:complete
VQNKNVTKVLSYKNQNITYDTVGHGDTIVFIHGFLEDSSIWNDYSDALKSKYNVIKIDLPGFGKSDIISDTHEMSLMADVVINVLEQESIDKYILVGHSMGGYVSLSVISNKTNNCKGLILVNSQAGPDDDTAKKNRDRAIDIVNKNHSTFISGFVESLFAEENISKYQKEINELTRSSLKTSNKGIIAALKGMKIRDDSLPIIKETNVPILFIIGKQDSKIPFKKIHEQSRLPRLSESLIMQNVGHMSFIEARDLCLATIECFTKKHL